MKKGYLIASALIANLLIGCATTTPVTSQPMQEEEPEITVPSNPEPKENPVEETSKPTVKTETPIVNDNKTEQIDSKPVVEEQKDSKPIEKPEEQKPTETKKEEPKPEDTKKDEQKPDTSSDETPSTETEPADTEIVKKVATLSAACKIANFQMEIPQTFAIYKPTEYSAESDYKVNVKYVNTKNKAETFTVRKAWGNLDVCEDAKTYNHQQFLSISGIRIFVRGDEEDRYNTATWTDGDYAYSIESDVGFPKEVIIALIEEVN